MATLDETKQLILKQRSVLWRHKGLSGQSNWGDVEEELFEESMDDLAGMADFIPAGTASILDIGCGMGAIDVLLSAHYPAAKLYVLDSDEPSPGGRKYRFGPAEGFWMDGRPSAGVAVRKDDWVFRIPDGAHPEVLLAFDLASDPWEQSDRFDPSLPEHAAIAKLLTEYKRRLDDAARLDDSEREMDDADLEQLKALGYLE